MSREAPPRQLVLDLGQRQGMDRASFFPSPANAEALAAIEPGANWPGGKLILIGPDGAGKSHLARIWAAENAAPLVLAADLPGQDLPALGSRIVIEDADRIAGNAAAETALFHLHNLILPAGLLLLTARGAPGDWGLRLQDLLSRLQAAGIARLGAPDDALLTAVLVKLFADRQLAVPPNLIPYLTSRIERSIAAARDLVDRLDHAGLTHGRPLTRALAAEVLDSAGK